MELDTREWLYRAIKEFTGVRPVRVEFHINPTDATWWAVRAWFSTNDYNYEDYLVLMERGDVESIEDVPGGFSVWPPTIPN